MITVRNKDDVTVCCIEGLVLSWGGWHTSDLYYDKDAELEMVAFSLIDSINNSTGSQWGGLKFVGNR